jgi:pilus assembly protein Flp/PilA
MTELFARMKGDEEGATAVEYGVMVALIIAVIVAIVAVLGQQLLAAFTKVSGEVGKATQ